MSNTQNVTRTPDHVDLLTGYSIIGDLSPANVTMN